MNRISTLAAVMLAAVLMAVATVSAEPGDGPPDRPRGERPDRERGPRGPEGGGRRGFRPPPNPFRTALDVDKDGEISAEELENAVTALKTMDENEDGKLTHEEVRPKRGDHAHGGPPGEGRRPEGRGPRDPALFVDFLLTFDADDDGLLSRKELMEGIKNRPQGHGGRKGRGPGPGGGKDGRPKAPPEE